MLAYQRTARRLEHGIEWRPIHDGFYPRTTVLVSCRDANLLCITQPALLDVERHLREEDVDITYGLLTGGLYECPETYRRYALVDSTIRSAMRLKGDDRTPEMVIELQRLMADAERSGKTPIGWYRGAPAASPHVLRREIALHHAMFPYEWQVMLLRDRAGKRGERHSAFVRTEPSELRGYVVPFLEILPAKSNPTEPAPRTAVLWRDYQATVDIDPLPESAFRHAASSRAKLDRTERMLTNGVVGRIRAGLLGFGHRPHRPTMVAAAQMQEDARTRLQILTAENHQTNTTAAVDRGPLTIDQSAHPAPAAPPAVRTTESHEHRESPTGSVAAPLASHADSVANIEPDPRSISAFPIEVPPRPSRAQRSLRDLVRGWVSPR